MGVSEFGAKKLTIAACALVLIPITACTTSQDDASAPEPCTLPASDSVTTVEAAPPAGGDIGTNPEIATGYRSGMEPVDTADFAVSTANPISTDALVREVRDPQTAEQVYLASALAIEPDTEAERSYLQYLAARLKLEPQRAEELHRIA